MRRLVPLFALLGLLAVAPAAHAGGFATVGLSSTPDGLGAGRPWHVQLTVLAHGRNAVPGIQPAITIKSGTATRTFRARETAKAGVYRASVVFPRQGTWRYEVRDGYIDEVHTFPPARIVAGPGGAAAERSIQPAPADGGIAWGWLAGAAAAFAAAALLLAGGRRRLPSPRPA
jgi:hypothetical protein